MTENALKMKTVKLGDIFTISSSRRVLKSQWKSSGVPFYRGREITRLSKTGNANNELFISEDLYNDLSQKNGVPAEGDIMITAIGTIGNTYTVRSNEKFYFKDASVLWLKKASGVDSGYVSQWFKSAAFFEQLESNGTTVDTLTITKLQSLEIYLPSLEEQRRVVGRLDAAFEKIDQAIELTEKNIQKSDQLFGSLLESSINHNPDVTHRTIGQIADIEYGLTEKAKIAGGLRLIRITDINPDGFLINEDAMYVDETSNAERYLLRRGDLVVARTGATFGKVLYFDNEAPSVFASYLIRINFKDDIHPKLFWYYAKTPQYWEQANMLSGGAAQPQFNGNALKRVEFSYPINQEEQQVIVDKLDTYHRSTLDLKATYRKRLDALTGLKQSLLTQAFSQSEVE